MNLPPLRPEQRLALVAVEWLVADEKTPTGERVNGKGRTHLLAIATIRAALRNPGIAQPVIDHDSDDPQRTTLPVVARLLDGSGLMPYATVARCTLQIDPPRALDAAATAHWRQAFDRARDAFLAL